jgi:peptidylprolyl isomerase
MCRYLPTALLCIALAVGGCGGDASPAANDGVVGAGAAEEDGARSRIPLGTLAEAARRSKPKVPKGPTSANLIVRDLIRGTGEVAESGDVLVVHYIGGIYETGEEIEYNWSVRDPVGFLLGSGDWAYGLEEGMQEMRVGGRRELIFPTRPDTVPPGSKLGDTLVYVVDLLAITEPSG